MPELIIGHLYPEHLNQMGDRGAILALVRRARWHGLHPKLVPLPPGGRFNLERCALLFMGGVREAGLKAVLTDLQKREEEIREQVEKEGLAVLAVCGSYRLLGHSFTAAGEKIPGLGLLDLHVENGPRRRSGDLIARCHLWHPPKSVAGFENHRELTFLGPSAKALGQVLRGCGNNGKDGSEGILYKNLIGTNLLGSFLPGNPWLTDYLLKKALQARGLDFSLSPLDDSLEISAHRYILKRSRSPLFRYRRTPVLEAASNPPGGEEARGFAAGKKRE